MTDIEITPDVLRAVADWLDDRGARGELRDIADKLDRQQADEKRLDELVDAFKLGTRGVEVIGGLEYLRAGIRAVLYRIEQEDAGVQTSKVCGQTLPIGEPFRCSLREGHSGPHEAWAGNSTNRELCATWENA